MDFDEKNMKITKNDEIWKKKLKILHFLKNRFLEFLVS